MVRFICCLVMGALTTGCGLNPTPPGKGKEPLQDLRRGIFVDVTDSAGIDFVHERGGTGEKWVPETMCSGACTLDFDSDGLMDLYVVQAGELFGADRAEFGNRLYRNLGNGEFADLTDHAGVGDTSYGQGAIAADYDGDGHVDIYVTNYGPNILYRNNGDGTFTDTTETAGVGDPLWGTSAAFFDGDGDGDIDLYLVNYVDFHLGNHRPCGDVEGGRISYCHPDCYPMQPDVFFRNLGDGTFVDATGQTGLVDTTGKGLGVVVADFNNDGLPDIYVANDSTPNFLYRNLGDGTYDEIGLLVGAAYNDSGRTQAGMGVDAGDLDHDGFLDIIVTHLSMEENALYFGGPDGFRYGTGTAGLYAPSFPVLGFGTSLLDVDNDGDLDIHVANGDVVDNIELFRSGASWRQPDQIFLNDGQGRFEELSAEAAGDLSVPRVGRGSLVFDFDNDGRLDLFVNHNGDRARLYRNTGGESNWIGLRLVGRGPNTGAIGARVIVKAGGRIQIREVRAGSGYQSSSDPRLHFGLGSAVSAEEVSVIWPNGNRQILSPLPPGEYTIAAQ